MLVLSRKQGERIVIGQDVVITVLESGQNRVRLGFAAPQGMPIFREEVFQRIDRDREELGEFVDRDREGSRFIVECG